MINSDHSKINSTLFNKIQTHELNTWMTKKGWRFFNYQLDVLFASKKYKNILIISPTGTGKTLAGFLPSFIDICDKDVGRSLHTLYISPLKSLAKDIKRSIEKPIIECGFNISLDIRTGDTSSNIRRKIIKTPPNFLVTTPESFALMMSYENSKNYFSNLKYIIIDELHNLINSKRGDLLSLNLARLKLFSNDLCTIGMSATIKNKQMFLSYLSNNNNTIAITSNIKNISKIRILPTKKKIPWSGHMAHYAIEEIYKKVALHRNTIIFVNTRAQSEYLFQKLWKINKLNLKIGVHHGSLAKELRENIEKRMLKGKLDCVIATSSLELGIDWGNLDLIIQVGAPKGIARILQRIGRSNHNIKTPSKAFLVPTNKFEYIECLAVIKSIKAGKIEDRVFKEGSLDVLAQHILGVACSNPFDSDKLFNNILSAFPYQKLERKHFNKVLGFVENGGYTLANYDSYSKIKKNKLGLYEVTNNKFIQKYRMNIGTIVEDHMVNIFLNKKKLGIIESYFINNLSQGDTFLFAGEVLQFDKVVLNGIQVKKTKKSKPKIPSFIGGRLPLSSELSKEVLNLINNYKNTNLPAQITEWLELQKSRSSLPPENGMLLETFSRNVGKQKNHYIVAYTFQGRNVNQTLGILILKKLQEYGNKPIAFVATDYAIALWSIEKCIYVNSIFSYNLLTKSLHVWLNNTSMVKKNFRSVATISGLINRRLPGHSKSGKQITFNSDLIYDVLLKYENNHILLESSKKETLYELVDYKRLSSFLKNIKNKIIYNDLNNISPLAVPLILEFNRETVEKNTLIKYEYEDLQKKILEEADISNEN